jgi:hypothetical protein
MVLMAADQRLTDIIEEDLANAALDFGIRHRGR